MKKRMADIFFWGAAFSAGIIAAVFVHYGLHRLLLTTEPFIYVSF